MEKKPTSPEEIAIDLAKWKLKRLIKNLDDMKGDGTSMITLVIPPKGQISLVSHMLTVEMGTASNIKSRVNRLSVLSAIESTQQKLKLYSKVPSNGLILFCGITNDKKISICFEPYKPIVSSMYICDSSFHTEALKGLITDDETYGFVIVDGNGVVFGKLCGTNKEILHKFVVNLPGKTRRGGQSANRIARTRDEKKANYIRKVVEKLNEIFLTHQVKGIIVAGNGHIKELVVASDLLDYRVRPLFVGKLLDIAYGGENGFQQAIEMSGEILKNVKYLKEKILLGKFQDEIVRDTGKICYGLKETMKLLDLRIINELIVCETIPYERYEYVSNDSKETLVSFCVLGDGRWVLSKQELLIEWLHDNYTNYGVKLYVITDCTPQGAQFSKGFGGIGGTLHYKHNIIDDAAGGAEINENLSTDESQIDSFADSFADFI